MSRAKIKERVTEAAEKIVSQQHYVSSIDVLVGMGSLQSSQVQDWRAGRILYLEKVISGNLSKISFAMHCFRNWALAKKLNPRETIYRRKTKRGGRRALQFSKSGDPQIEKAYSTHYVSSYLSDKKKESPKELGSPAPSKLSGGEVFSQEALLIE